ncbi:SEUSS family protein [Striga asiatica]|uniref:SEUSS family protein n=2 Tax=Striga TaxID=4169 RepID=A0A5A7Q0V3_STRAF|nr:SEUSS family protein [Striga asiatica]
MVPQGPPNPLGGGQPIPPSLLRSNSGLLGGQGPGIPSQNAFPSLVSPRNQFNNLNMLGNNNVSSLLHQSFGNGGPGSSHHGLVDSGPDSSMGNGMGFATPTSSYLSSPVTANENPSSQVQGQQHQFPNISVIQKQLDSQNFQHNNGSNQPQQQFQGMRPGMGPVKLEQQSTANEQASQQQFQGLRNMGSVKMEAQQMQNMGMGMSSVKMESQQIPSMRGLGPVKLESQHSDPSLFLQQQQQQQQLIRQSSQAAAAAQILHQQRLIQMQQQQLLKAMPQQRSPIQQQQQQQFQQQNLTIRSPVKPVYEPGMCARRLTHYMYQQQHRPEDNNIEFWRKFVAEYFAPNAKKKWCVSMYGSGRQTTGVFPQDVWHCEICNRKPGRGFEATVEVLPRLFKIKYESGTIEELLYVDMPREYQNSSGQIVLDYAKAIQESVFEQLRVVRDGQLRIVFSPDLKICSWEFCARRHEELIPRRLLIPQVGQLGNAAQKYQAATQNTSANINVSELQNNCNMFVASARQLAKALEVPLVNDLGYTKRYVRCLQISEVVNSMKDLIDYSRETGSGPMESLKKFPRRTNPSPAFQGQSHSQQQEAAQLHQQQQTMGQTAQTSNNDNNPIQPTSANNTTIHSAGPTNPSTGPIANLLHQNSINSRPTQNPIPGPNNPSYVVNNTVQMPSPGGSSCTMPQANNPTPSPFHSPTPSSSNNNNNNNNNNNPHPIASTVNSPNIPGQQQSLLSNDGNDANDPQSSVQKIIHDMMMSSSSQMGLGSMGSEMKNNVNGVLSSSGSGGNVLMGSGVGNGHSVMGVSGFGGMHNGPGQLTMVNGIRAALGNNNGRVGMGREQGIMNPQQQDMSSQLLAGFGAVNGFNNLQFDWKTSP